MCNALRAGLTVDGSNTGGTVLEEMMSIANGGEGEFTHNGETLCWRIRGKVCGFAWRYAFYTYNNGNWDWWLAQLPGCQRAWFSGTGCCLMHSKKAPEAALAVAAAVA